MQQINRIFTIRAYCSDCKKLLLVSNPMTRKELMVNWDSAVFDAPGIECKDCGHKMPNFNLKLVIYNAALKKEFNPALILPKTNYDFKEEAMKQVLFKK